MPLNDAFMPFDARRTPYGFGKNYWTTLCHENNNAWGPMHESNGNKHEIELPVYEDAPNVPDIRRFQLSYQLIKLWRNNRWLKFSGIHPVFFVVV